MCTVYSVQCVQWWSRSKWCAAVDIVILEWDQVTAKLIKLLSEVKTRVFMTSWSGQCHWIRLGNDKWFELWWSDWRCLGVMRLIAADQHLISSAQLEQLLIMAGPSLTILWKILNQLQWCLSSVIMPWNKLKTRIIF